MTWITSAAMTDLSPVVARCMMQEPFSATWAVIVGWVSLFLFDIDKIYSIYYKSLYFYNINKSDMYSIKI